MRFTGKGERKGGKMERIYAKERGCCEASWEVEDVKKGGGEWEGEKRRSRGTQQRFLLIVDTLSFGWGSVCVRV